MTFRTPSADSITVAGLSGVRIIYVIGAPMEPENTRFRVIATVPTFAARGTARTSAVILAVSALLGSI